MSKPTCSGTLCAPSKRTNRSNLTEARKALGEGTDSLKLPYIKKYGISEKKMSYCTVCEDLVASTRNAVLRAIKKNLNKVHFNKIELSILIRLYIELLGGNFKKELSIQDFKQFLTSTLGILEPFALDGISRAVRVANKLKTISVDEFLYGLSVLLRGTLTEKIDFAFKVIDFDSDGFLRKNNEITSLLVGAFNPQISALNPDLDPEEPERDTVNYLYQRLVNGNTIISLEDFRVKVLEEPLLLECLIPFLPIPEKAISFQEVFLSDVVIIDQWISKVARIRCSKTSTI